MTPQEALNLLARAAAEYRGTAQEHGMLAEAAQTLAALVSPPKPDAPPVDPAVEKTVARFAPKGGPKVVRTRRGKPEQEGSC